MGDHAVTLMQVDIAGRVRNTQLSRAKPLRPIFEAVRNSFQAIAERRVASGEISITVLRAEDLLLRDSVESAKVTGFAVHDNGVGFNSANWQSFLTSDSTAKLAEGGRGVGRFLWLKAFESVHVESVFEERGSHYRRTFSFLVSANGVDADTLEELDAPEEVGTTVKLVGLRPEYQQLMAQRSETIAERLVEHFLLFFLQDDPTSVSLLDGATRLDLRSVYKENWPGRVAKASISVGSHAFDMTTVRVLPTAEGARRIHLCANRWEVESVRLGTVYPDLGSTSLQVDGEKFAAAIYVQGAYLDENVNQEREKIAFRDPDEPEELFALLDRAVLLAAIEEKAREDLAEPLKVIEDVKREQVESFVKQHPGYRVLLQSDPELLSKLPADASEERLDQELHRVEFEQERGLKAAVSKVLRDDVHDPKRMDDYRTELRAVLDKLGQVGTAKLAEYVVHRKLVLDLLAKAVRARKAGGFELEEAVHGLLVPLGTEAEEVPQGRLNLWVVDERLVFHRYVASDKALKKHRGLSNTSSLRPDVLCAEVFDRRLGFTAAGAAGSAMAIVEFKRPMRGDYDDKDNPINQVYRYAEAIRSGQAKDKDGRLVSLAHDSVMHGYVIADITPKMKEFAKQATLKAYPDGTGYFGYNEAYMVWVEVWSYDRIVDDARKRNEMFFRQLGI